MFYFTKLYQITYEDGDAEEQTNEEVAGILTKEDEAKSLLGSYAIHLAVCEYIGPEKLYNQLKVTLPMLSLESSQSKAKKYLENSVVHLHSDDEDDNNNHSEDCSLTFSLLCSISRQPIITPVRGKICKHMQCFDLKSFLDSNRHVSGGRWRCAVCEDFVSVRDLVRCGLFEAMLKDHREAVSGARDKVSFKPDGTWSLKEANKLRYAGRGRGSGGAEVDTQQIANVDSQKAAQPEVIDLL